MPQVAQIHQDRPHSVKLQNKGRCKHSPLHTSRLADLETLAREKATMFGNMGESREQISGPQTPTTLGSKTKASAASADLVVLCQGQ